MTANEKNNKGFRSLDLEEDAMLKMDGYNDCIIGTVEQFGKPTIWEEITK